jgi:serine/threonine-protein kinase
MQEFAFTGFVRRGAELAHAVLPGRDLSGLDLSHTGFAGARMAGCNFTGAGLCGARMAGAELAGAVFTNADRSGADLTDADLAGADFGGAKPSDALLEGADLTHAKLEPADLAGATLARASLPPDTSRSMAPPGTEWDKDTLIGPVTGIRLSWFPGGRFQLGSESELNESPVHWVRIRSFWLGQTPVTNGQYAAFLELTEHREPAHYRDPRFSGPRQPVVGVSYEDALQFCQWLSDVSGLQVTLPSAAQWEYAARGTDGREYSWGKEEPEPSRACDAEDATSGRPAPVGSYPPGQGPYGTLDQAGNVWEWCLDSWDDMAYVKRAGQELVDPVITDGTPGVQLVRGGSWCFPVEDLRATFRGRNEAESRDDDLGFRVAIS